MLCTLGAWTYLTTQHNSSSASTAKTLLRSVPALSTLQSTHPLTEGLLHQPSIQCWPVRMVVASRERLCFRLGPAGARGSRKLVAIPVDSLHRLLHTSQRVLETWRCSVRNGRRSKKITRLWNSAICKWQTMHDCELPFLFPRGKPQRNCTWIYEDSSSSTIRMEVDHCTSNPNYLPRKLCNWWIYAEIQSPIVTTKFPLFAVSKRGKAPPQAEVLRKLISEWSFLLA